MLYKLVAVKGGRNRGPKGVRRFGLGRGLGRGLTGAGRAGVVGDAIGDVVGGMVRCGVG